MKLLRHLVAIALVLLASGTAASGCEVAAPPVDRRGNYGFEVTPNLTILVHHEGKPLPSAIVSIRTAETGEELHTFSTDKKGRVRIRQLKQGNYRIDAHKLGLVAGSDWFHVAPQPSIFAKASLKYEWAEVAVPTVQVQGRIVGVAGSPIVAGSIEIVHGFIGARFTTASDDSGMFEFGEVPPGPYILKVTRERVRNLSNPL